MAFELSFQNIILFISYISPVLLGFFLVMTSVFNQDMKGIMYLAGVLMLCMVGGGLLRTQMKIPAPLDKSPICDMIQVPFLSNYYQAPIFSTLVVAFTLAYLFWPMLNTGINVPVLISLIVLLLLDLLINTYHKCGGVANLFLSTFFGMLFGTIWYYVINASTDGNLTYFSDLPSNQVVCRKPKAETYKCKVYKNGRLLKTM